jgi:hypothetical protein
MPHINKMKKTMMKLKVPPEIMAQMELDVQTDGGDPSLIIPVINKMDELLTKEQVFAIMEQQGCCKSGKRDKDCKAFAKEHADKPLEEKLALLSGVQYMMAPHLNEDGTLTVTMCGYQNGVHTRQDNLFLWSDKKTETAVFCITTILRLLRGTFFVSLSKCFGCQVKTKRNKFIAA